MTDLTIEKFQQLLDDHLRRTDQLKTLESEVGQAPADIDVKRAALAIRLRRRLWKYFGLLERVFTKAGSQDYWIPNPKPPLLEMTGKSTAVHTNMDIAVHMHVYFLDLLPELLFHTQCIGQSFTCYVTTDRNDKAAAIQTLIDHHPFVKLSKIIVTPNRGRDIAPWIIEMAKYNDDHELFCHIHTKKSLHVPSLGTGWRRFLLTQLLGSKSSVEHILTAFNLDPELGLVIPPFYRPAFRNILNDWDEPDRAKQFFQSLNIAERPPKYPIFSAGSMCWYRPQALSKLFRLNLKYDDFEQESNQAGMTLMHIIERSLVYITQSSGLDFSIVLPVESTKTTEKT